MHVSAHMPLLSLILDCVSRECCNAYVLPLTFRHLIKLQGKVTGPSAGFLFEGGDMTWGLSHNSPCLQPSRALPSSLLIVVF